MKRFVVLCVLLSLIILQVYSASLVMGIYEKETVYLEPRLGYRFGLRNGPSVVEADFFDKGLEIGLTATRKDSFSSSLQFHFSSLSHSFNTTARFGFSLQGRHLGFLGLVGPGVLTQNVRGNPIVNLSLCFEAELSYEIAQMLYLSLYWKTNSNLCYDTQFSWFPGLTASLHLDRFSFGLEWYIRSNSFFRPPVSITEWSVLVQMGFSL